MFNRLLKDTAVTGAVLTGTTTLAILAASTNENGGSWGAINSVSHIVDGDEVTYGDNFSLRDSSIGLGINATAMFAWAFLYRLIFGGVKFPKSAATAAIFTAGAYAIDYYIVPDQYTPGIEKKINKKSIFAIYTIIALILATSPLFLKRNKK